MKIWPWLRTVTAFMIRRSKVEREMEEEFRSHLESRAEDLQRQGLSREEAERRARIEFGAYESYKEECREALGTRLLQELAADLRYGLRQLRRNPGFTIVAVLTLALGIGANTAIFSVLNAALVRPLAFPQPDQLVAAAEFYPKFNHSIVLTPEYAAWRQQNKAFEQLAACGISIGVNLSEGSSARRVAAGHVTPNYFRVLNVHPILGRSFVQGEEQYHLAILSYGLWQTYFASDSGILGKTVTLNGISYTVIGVMPQTFRDPMSPDAEIWLPDAVPLSATQPGRGMRLVNVIGRMKPGVTVPQARADLEVIARRMDHQYPTPWSAYHAKAKVRLVGFSEALTSEMRPEMLILAGAAALVLLIACANVAGLLLARGMSREKEFAVRAALGASRPRLIRSLLTESILLAILGGLIGSGLAVWGARALTFLMPAALSAHNPLDSHVLIFALLCSAAAGLVFGLTPALAASRIDLDASMKERTIRLGAARRKPRLRAALATLQLSLSLILLIGAGLLIRSFVLLLEINPGFDTHNVLIAEVSLPPSVYDPPHQADFFHQVLGRIQRLPGVTYAAAVDAPPLGTFNTVARGLQPEGQPESDAVVGIISVSPDYFRALHIPLLKGRFFDQEDISSAVPVAIVNQSLARALFTTHDPLGRRIKMSDKGPWLTVVGEVADITQRKLDDKLWPELFVPYLQSPAAWMTLVVRTASDPLGLGPGVVKSVQEIDKAEPVFGVETLDERLSGSLAARREKMILLGMFAAMALAIAVVGLYGLMSYSVGQRTHEIGIRMALGAERGDVLKMVIGEGLKLALIGVAIGISGALALTRFLSSLLYGVKPTDPLTFIAVSLILIAVALLACYIPARRAAKVDPMIALRYE